MTARTKTVLTEAQMDACSDVYDVGETPKGTPLGADIHDAADKIERIAALLEKEGHPAWSGGRVIHDVVDRVPAAQQAAGPPVQAAPRGFGTPPARALAPVAVADAVAAGAVVARPELVRDEPAPAYAVATRHEPAGGYAVAAAGPVFYTAEQLMEEDGAAGLDLRLEDVRIAGFAIRQGTTKDAQGIQLGHFMLRKHGPDSASPTRSLILLRNRSTRELMLSMEDVKAQHQINRIEQVSGRLVDAGKVKGSVCWSPDRKLPSAAVPAEHKMAASCVRCPATRWVDGEGRLCNEAFSAFLIDEHTGTPVRWTLRGSAARAWASYMNVFTPLARTSKPYAFRFQVKTKEMESKKGTAYYVPVFGAATPTGASQDELMELSTTLAFCLNAEAARQLDHLDDASEDEEVAS